MDFVEPSLYTGEYDAPNPENYKVIVVVESVSNDVILCFLILKLSKYQAASKKGNPARRVTSLF